MERRKTEDLTNLLFRFMRESGLETPLNQHRLINSWKEVAGEAVTKQTTDIFIRNQSLYVRIKSPALRANLMMNRQRLVSLLNASVKADVITELILI